MLISVIVPIYNVEAYLAKCIESIINQSYSDIEIILVNDGSTDNSSQICEKYQKLDNRIKVITKANGGISEARNFGIENAKGDYFVFVDSDDYIHPQMIELLYEAVIKCNAKIAICRFIKVKENDRIDFSGINHNEVEYRVLNATEALMEQFDIHEEEFVVAWNKLYHRELFDNNRYPVGKINEDVFLTYKLLYSASRVVYVNVVLYYYLQRNDSIMRKPFSKKRFDDSEARRERVDFFIEKGIPINKALKSYLDRYEENIKMFAKYYCDDTEGIEAHKEKYKKDLQKYMKVLSPKGRVVLYLKLKLPGVCSFVRTCRRKIRRRFLKF